MKTFIVAAMSKIEKVMSLPPVAVQANDILEAKQLARKRMRAMGFPVGLGMLHINSVME